MQNPPLESLIDGIGNLPITFDLSAWWSRGAWICVLLLAVLALWAFRTALGGRAILDDA